MDAMAVPTARATLSLLYQLRNVVEPLRAVLHQLDGPDAAAIQGDLERCGRVVLAQGDPLELRVLDQRLRAAGLVTSMNHQPGDSFGAG